MLQRVMRFELPAELELITRERADLTRAINGKNPNKIPHEKQFSDMLKRQARRVMADITECPPDTLPAHLVRLDELREIMMHNVYSAYSETPESRLSGNQLQFHPSTLADYLALLEITRRQHRAPAYVNNRDAELAAINHKLDLLAGLVAGLLGQPTPAAFTNQEGEEERA